MTVIAEQSRLTEIREANGLTQTKAAELMNTYPSMIHKHENDTNHLTITWLRKYAKVYNCKVSDLLLEEDCSTSLDPQSSIVIRNLKKLSKENKNIISKLIAALQ